MCLDFFTLNDEKYAEAEKNKKQKKKTGCVLSQGDNVKKKHCPTGGRWWRVHYVTLSNIIEVKITKRGKAHTTRSSFHLVGCKCSCKFQSVFAEQCVYISFQNIRPVFRLGCRDWNLLDRKEALQNTMNIFPQIIITPKRGQQQPLKIKVTFKCYNKTYTQKLTNKPNNMLCRTGPNTSAQVMGKGSHFRKGGTGTNNQESGKPIK